MAETVGNSGARIFAGIVAIAGALAISFWAHEHSPHMGFGELLMHWDGYIIKEPIYSVIMIFAVMMGVLGVIAIVRGFQGAHP